MTTSELNNTRNLVISPDTKYWDRGNKLLFCCDYCINNKNKHLLSKTDYKILDDEVFETEYNLRQIKFCEDIYEKLLDELRIPVNPWQTYTLERVWRKMK